MIKKIKYLCYAICFFVVDFISLLSARFLLENVEKHHSLPKFYELLGETSFSGGGFYISQ